VIASHLCLSLYLIASLMGCKPAETLRWSYWVENNRVTRPLTPVPQPQFIEHPRPDLLEADDSILNSLGCDTGDDEYIEYCVSLPELSAFECDRISATHGLFGGLQSDYSVVAMCHNGATGLHYTGCRFGTVSAIIMRNGSLALIDSLDALREASTPIESADEALSYVLLGTEFTAQYDFEFQPHYQYWVDPVEETHVTATNEGYVVNVFKYDQCGCSDTGHVLLGVDMLVRFDGTMEAIASRDIYTDTSDTACYD
jgi:hypothetical protein